MKNLLNREYGCALLFIIQVSLEAEERQILDVFFSGVEMIGEVFICSALRMEGCCEVFGELLKIPALCCCLTAIRPPR